jgi:hypothetical protein
MCWASGVTCEEYAMTDRISTNDAPVELSGAELDQVAGGIGTVKVLPFNNGTRNAATSSPVIFSISHPETGTFIVVDAPPG